MALISFAELAALKGVSNAAVTHATKRRIAAAVVEHEGRRMVDRDLALELWDRNTVITHNTAVGLASERPRKVERPKPEAPRPTAKELKRAIKALPDDQIPELTVSRERREHYQAELAKLEVDHKRRELVAAESVKKEAFSLAKTIREALVSIPDRVANVLAAETDPTLIHQALSEEIGQALERLANA